MRPDTPSGSFTSREPYGIHRLMKRVRLYKSLYHHDPVETLITLSHLYHQDTDHDTMIRPNTAYQQMSVQVFGLICFGTETKVKKQRTERPQLTHTVPKTTSVPAQHWKSWQSSQAVETNTVPKVSDTGIKAPHNGHVRDHTSTIVSKGMEVSRPHRHLKKKRMRDVLWAN